jgi:CRP-like cAMP-binding protein
MNTSSNHAPIENRILASLPDKEREQILAHLEPFHLDHSAVIYEIGSRIEYVYFPNSGMVSLISHTEEGETLEVCIVGFEGLVGLSVFLESDLSQYRAIVQGTGDALRMKSATFTAECERRASLRRLIRRYTQARMIQVTQAAICNRFHSMEERLSRWLLQTQDCMRSDELQLTQEFIAMMLGTHRPGVTIAAGILQSAGLIHYNRGHITILDREHLEAASCECYKVFREAYRWFART